MVCTMTKFSALATVLLAGGANAMNSQGLRGRSGRTTQSGGLSRISEEGSSSTSTSTSAASSSTSAASSAASSSVLPQQRRAQQQQVGETTAGLQDTVAQLLKRQQEAAQLLRDTNAGLADAQRKIEERE